MTRVGGSIFVRVCCCCKPFHSADLRSISEVLGPFLSLTQPGVVMVSVRATGWLGYETWHIPWVTRIFEL